MKKASLFFFFFTFLAFSFGQRIDLPEFNPGISAVALTKDQLEINVSSTFGYKQEVFNFGAPPYRTLEGESNSLSNVLQMTYGLSAQRNFNVGLDFNYSLGFSDFFIGEQRIEATNTYLLAGPRIRWRPFGSIGKDLDLTFQHFAQFVVADPNELFQATAFIGNQLIFTKYFLDENLILLFQADLLFLPKSSNEQLDRKQPLATPVTLFFGYAPRTNFIIFTSLNYNPEFGTIPWEDSDRVYRRRSGASLGLGLQYIWLNSYSLFLVHQLNLVNERGGGANSISVGVRLLFE